MTDAEHGDCSDTDDDFSWPATWSASAIDAAETVLEAVPDLAGAGWAALEQAGSLISQADRLDELALAAGLTATGSTGQEILHPGVTEARLSRTGAAQILARLADLGAGTEARETDSRRQTRVARARWSKRG